MRALHQMNKPYKATRGNQHKPHYVMPKHPIGDKPPQNRGFEDRSIGGPVHDRSLVMSD
jgi:hypothetical protein